jgi:glucose/arabinose dehydrogenase
VNYGWPRVTYGTDYLTFTWPLNAQQGRHEGFQEPVYAFVPSIGISTDCFTAQKNFNGFSSWVCVIVQK